MTVDVKKLFNEELNERLTRNTEAARKIGGVFQMNITGAGTWTVDLNSDTPNVKDGAAANPDVTIDIAESDFQTLISDPKKGMGLFFAGKLKVKGNQTKAIKLQDLFALK
jgi:putative sterol carrier protein